jgi:4-amino-4-deoxy-L-arabinose transferase-like glycosyltransferase
MSVMGLLIIAGLVVAGGAVPQIPARWRAPLGLTLFALGVVVPVAIIVASATPRPTGWAIALVAAALGCFGLMALTIARTRPRRQRVTGLVAAGLIGTATVVIGIITTPRP